MTQCSRPLAPSDEELVRHALDGETLSIAAKEHLEQCTFCQQRLASYTSTNAFLLSHFYRSQCPESTILSHYCMGILSEDRATSVTKHLDICPLCMNEVAGIRLLLATFEPFPPEHSSAPTALRTTLHSVASPTPWQPQPITENGSGYERERSWPRQYQADTISISLHLTHDRQGNSLLLGQLSSTNEAEHIGLFTNTKVELYAIHDTFLFTEKEYSPETGDPHSPLLSTLVDELGHIVFTSVLSGRYLMILYLLEKEIVIEELNISCP